MHACQQRRVGVYQLLRFLLNLFKHSPNSVSLEHPFLVAFDITFEFFNYCTFQPLDVFVSS